MAGQDNIVLRHLVWHDTCGGCHSSLTPSGLVALSRESIRGVNLLNVYFKMTCKSVRWRKVVVGKPVIKGTRLTVEYILNLLAHGATIAEILAKYHGLTQEDIQACLLFAARALEDTSFMPLVTERT